MQYFDLSQHEQQRTTFPYEISSLRAFVIMASFGSFTTFLQAGRKNAPRTSSQRPSRSYADNNTWQMFLSLLSRRRSNCQQKVAAM